MNHLFVSILLVTAAVVLPFFSETILHKTVENLPFGWVTTTFALRALVMLLFTLGLHYFFQVFQRTKTIKKGYTLLIGLPVGFLISFAVFPIYNVDYGMFNDDFKLTVTDELSEATEYTYEYQGGYELLAFVDVGCSFCEMATEKLAINQRAGQKVPIHLIFSGEEEYILAFLERNNASELTYHRIKSGEGNFIKFAGFSFPSIFLIGPDGTSVYHWVGDQMNYTALDYLLDLKQ